MKWLSKILIWLGLAQKKKPSGMTLQERKEELVSQQEQLRRDLERANKCARTWCNRAMMARQQNNEELVQQALQRMWEYQVLAAKLLGEEPPPEPKDIPPDFGDGTEYDDQSGFDRPWRPFDPSRVPKNPLPSSGSGEVALPLPKEDFDT